MQPDYFADFPSWKWHKRNCSVSFPSFLIYILPLILVFVDSIWAQIGMWISLLLGLWLAKPDRRIAALIAYGCLLIPNGWVNVIGFVGAFWMTSVRDGQELNNQTPKSEWD